MCEWTPRYKVHISLATAVQLSALEKREAECLPPSHRTEEQHVTSVDWCPPEASSSLCLTSARSLEGYSLGEMNLGEARTRREAKGWQREFQRGCGIEEFSTQTEEMV